MKKGLIFIVIFLFAFLIACQDNLSSSVTIDLTSSDEITTNTEGTSSITSETSSSSTLTTITTTSLTSVTTATEVRSGRGSTCIHSSTSS